VRLRSRPVRLAAFTLLAAGLTAEGGARLAGLEPTLGASDVPVAITAPDPRLGYTLRAGATFAYAGVTTTANRLGLRGDAPALDEPVTVLALGDELTFGWGVGDPDSYPAVLGRWFKDRCPTCGPVVNAGVPGYTSYQGLMLLRALGPVVRPRIVVAAFHLNDARLDAAADAPHTLPRDTIIGDRIDAWLQRASWFYGGFRQRRLQPAPGWWTTTARVSPSRYNQTLRALNAEADVEVDHRRPDVPAAGPHRVQRGRFEGDYHATMREVAALQHAGLVEFVGPELDATTMTDTVHPNAEGYRRIAASVGNLLEARGLLRPDGPS
jgi:lysophospholipase L1-like esterase